MMHKVIFPSAANAATVTSPAITVDGYIGGIFYLNITNITGTLDVKLQRMDKISGNWVDLPGGAFAQKNGTGTSELVIYPGVAETSNVSVSDVLGSPLRAVGTIGTGPCTFSLGVEFVS